MRTAFIKTLFDEASRSDVWLLTADLGYSVIEDFQTAYPERFVNVGIAEQNMTGIAAGLAMSGQNVFTYSIANFPTFRCLEQIRNDICYHKLSVNVVAVGGGCSYGALGYTHHGVEDIGVMRTLPNMRVLAPGDAVEAEAATEALCKSPGPAYLRLGKSGDERIHSEDRFEFRIGEAITVRQGHDITLMSTGGMLGHCVKTAEDLARRHRIQARVLSMHSLKPVDELAIEKAANETAGIVTVEDHNISSGLGQIVADVICRRQLQTRLSKFGIRDDMCHIVGDQDYMLSRIGSLESMAVELLRGKLRIAA